MQKQKKTRQHETKQTNKPKTKHSYYLYTLFGGGFRFVGWLLPAEGRVSSRPPRRTILVPVHLSYGCQMKPFSDISTIRHRCPFSQSVFLLFQRLDLRSFDDMSEEKKGKVVQRYQFGRWNRQSPLAYRAATRLFFFISFVIDSLNFACGLLLLSLLMLLFLPTSSSTSSLLLELLQSLTPPTEGGGCHAKSSKIRENKRKGIMRTWSRKKTQRGFKRRTTSDLV